MDDCQGSTGLPWCADHCFCRRKLAKLNIVYREFLRREILGKTMLGKCVKFSPSLIFYISRTLNDNMKYGYFSLCLILAIPGRSQTQRKFNPREKFPIYGNSSQSKMKAKADTCNDFYFYFFNYHNYVAEKLINNHNLLNDDKSWYYYLKIFPHGKLKEWKRDFSHNCTEVATV